MYIFLLFIYIGKIKHFKINILQWVGSEQLKPNDPSEIDPYTTSQLSGTRSMEILNPQEIHLRGS